MDSRLLNVFHDDPFDGNYMNNTDFWSDSSEAMGLQLTETLHGILPITGAGDDTDTYTTNVMLKDEYQMEHDRDMLSNFSNQETLLYDNLTEQRLATGGAIEIITVDSRNIADTDSDDELIEVDPDDIETDTDVEQHFAELETQSQCSDATFRTRTDSSSIGDYESHTSDYDEEDDEEDDYMKYQQLENYEVLGAEEIAQDESEYRAEELPGLNAGILAPDDFELDTSLKLPLETMGGKKNRTFSTNTIGSDVEGLGLHFDVNNFDLAEFITKDDFAVNTKVTSINSISSKKTTVTKQKSQTSEENTSDTDTDSDVIVDIETVEVESEKAFLQSHGTATADNGPKSDIAYIDNVAKDPSWSPKQPKKSDATAKEVKTRGKTNKQNNNKFSIIPSKRQCDFLKGKFGATRGKSIPKSNHVKLASKKSPQNCAEKAAKPGSLTCRVGVGQGGKNLAMLLKANERNTEQTAKKEEKTVEMQKTEDVQNLIKNEIDQETTEATQNSVTQAAQSVKRKLNLEEYKRRRGDIPSNAVESDKVQKAVSGIQTTPNKSNIQSSQTKHSEAVTSIVKSLREQIKPVSGDPITEAKNKVLRMQELKRAQQLKIIDSTISAKVARVTKLPPLKDIVKDTYPIEDEKEDVMVATKLNSEYEEITILSVGTNTDITIPPLNILPINTSSRSLLKSSALLYNTNNSLIASIQDVVVKKVAKVMPNAENRNIISRNSAAKSNNEATEQHGENKIIMHLRKDRIRPPTATIETQTDTQSAFPPLVRQRTYCNRRRNDENSLAIQSAESETETMCPTRYSRSRHSPIQSRQRSRSRSVDSYISSSVEHMRQSDTAGGYSSRSSRRHRSSVSSSYSESVECLSRNRRQRRSSYKQRAKKYSRSSSSSSSDSDYSDRSRSRSRSRSHSKNRSPYYRRSRSRSRSRSISRSRSRRRGYNSNYGMVSQPAVEERRIVYVGRIEQETTKEMLRRKFLPYGTIKQITIHYKENGMKYGFVTYEHSQDAFTVIDNSARDPAINMYDISFGGRRAFCRASYADLDNAGINTYHSFVFPQAEPLPKEEDSFEALLLKVKAKMNANKSTNSNATNSNKI